MNSFEAQEKEEEKEEELTEVAPPPPPVADSNVKMIEDVLETLKVLRRALRKCGKKPGENMEYPLNPWESWEMDSNLYLAG